MTVVILLMFSVTSLLSVQMLLVVWWNKLLLTRRVFFLSLLSCVCVRRPKDTVKGVFTNTSIQTKVCMSVDFWGYLKVYWCTMNKPEFVVQFRATHGNLRPGYKVRGRAVPIRKSFSNISYTASAAQSPSMPSTGTPYPTTNLTFSATAWHGRPAGITPRATLT